MPPSKLLRRRSSHRSVFLPGTWLMLQLISGQPITKHHSPPLPSFSPSLCSLQTGLGYKHRLFVLCVISHRSLVWYMFDWRCLQTGGKPQMEHYRGLWRPLVDTGEVLSTTLKPVQIQLKTVQIWQKPFSNPTRVSVCTKVCTKSQNVLELSVSLYSFQKQTIQHDAVFTVVVTTPRCYDKVGCSPCPIFQLSLYHFICVFVHFTYDLQFRLQLDINIPGLFSYSLFLL